MTVKEMGKKLISLAASPCRKYWYHYVAIYVLPKVVLTMEIFIIVTFSHCHLTTLFAFSRKEITDTLFKTLFSLDINLPLYTLELNFMVNKI